MRNQLQPKKTGKDAFDRENSMIRAGNTRRFLGFILMMFFLFMPYVSHSASYVESGISLPEAKRTDLPSANGLVRETKKIISPAQRLDFSRLTQTYNKLPTPIRHGIDKVRTSLGQLLKKLWKLFVRSRQQRLPEYRWVDWVRSISVPLILGTILYFIYHLVRRFRRDIGDTAATSQVKEETWQKLWRRAWQQREDHPKEALHGLMAAVVRRLIIDGRIPNDPAQTLREIERCLAREGKISGDVKAFSILREGYEKIYYGQQTPLGEEQWNSLRTAALSFLGEVPL